MSRNNVKFMECKVVSNLVSNEEIKITPFFLFAKIDNLY